MISQYLVIVVATFEISHSWDHLLLMNLKKKMNIWRFCRSPEIRRHVRLISENIWQTLRGKKNHGQQDQSYKTYPLKEFLLQEQIHKEKLYTPINDSLISKP